MKRNISVLIPLILPIIIFSCKKDDSVVPEIFISNDVFAVSEDISQARINLTMSEATDRDVSVDYYTGDSTAAAGQNYEAASGTLTFPVGARSASFNINIIQDTASKQDLYFKVRFSNVSNAVLRNTTLEIKVINTDYSTLIWSDEFESELLNTAWWNYELGNNNGWGNNEWEIYTDQSENVHLDSGYLHITALNPGPASYTSGRITTLGKKEFTYGRIEIRAKMPIGQGIWPALWMLGSNITTVGWPRCGEIDIMEYLGHQPQMVYGTLHWNENGHKYIGGNKSISAGSYHSDFHVFSLIWTPGMISWLVDGQQFYNRTRSGTSAFPFDLPQFLIFNVAVGGNWPGYPDETTTFPQHMIVDYVRVYQ